MSAVVVPITAARRRRHARPSSPVSLVDVDGAIAEVERQLSEQRLRSVTLPPGSLLQQWAFQNVLALKSALDELEAVRRRMVEPRKLRVVP
jgi:hypothetical protein